MRSLPYIQLATRKAGNYIQSLEFVRADLTPCCKNFRLLLALCKAAHQFSMAIAPRLNEAKREEEERLKWDGDQRISVISSTSSNTTSGIVSDRVHSEDELEIMITSPPAPSTESLALAHLLDSAPASSRTSAASATAALSTLSIKDEESESGKKEACSESSGKTNSGKCAGSQCSSSCSTVVITPLQNSKLFYISYVRF